MLTLLGNNTGRVRTASGTVEGGGVPHTCEYTGRSTRRCTLEGGDARGCASAHRTVSQPCATAAASSTRANSTGCRSAGCYRTSAQHSVWGWPTLLWLTRPT